VIVQRLFDGLGHLHLALAFFVARQRSC